MLDDSDREPFSAAPRPGEDETARVSAYPLASGGGESEQNRGPVLKVGLTCRARIFLDSTRRIYQWQYLFADSGSGDNENRTQVLP